GFVEGENVVVEYRWGDNQIDRLPALAADLVFRRVAVIAAVTNTAALAAKAATATTPIVFLASDDPVRMGLVSNLASPDGNLTGMSFLAAELAAKRIELLRQLVPRISRIAVFVDPTNPTATESTLRDLGEAGRAMGLQVDVHNAADIGQIEQAFTSFARERPDALSFRSSPYLYRPAVQISPPGGAPQAAGDIPMARLCGSRRADELWSKPARCNTSGWILYWPHNQGRETCRSAGPTVEQV